MHEELQMGYYATFSRLILEYIIVDITTRDILFCCNSLILHKIGG